MVIMIAFFVAFIMVMGVIAVGFVIVFTLCRCFYVLCIVTIESFGFGSMLVIIMRMIVLVPMGMCVFGVLMAVSLRCLSYGLFCCFQLLFRCMRMISIRPVVMIAASRETNAQHEKDD
jgi:hypothetical protein